MRYYSCLIKDLRHSSLVDVPSYFSGLGPLIRFFWELFRSDQCRNPFALYPQDYALVVNSYIDVDCEEYGLFEPIVIPFESLTEIHQNLLNTYGSDYRLLSTDAICSIIAPYFQQTRRSVFLRRLNRFLCSFRRVLSCLFKNSLGEKSE